MFNSKVTKKGLVDYLVEVQPKLLGRKFKNLSSRVGYTLKKYSENVKSVDMTTLFELASEIAEFFPAKQKLQVENSLKVAKAEGKKVINLKSKVEVASTNSAKQNTLVNSFPEELESSIGLLRLNKEINNMEDLYKIAIDEQKDIVFAFYWNARQLAQFAYDVDSILDKKIKNFPNDLDLAKVNYMSEELRVAYATSLYSEVSYTIKPEALIVDAGLRFCKGCEFQIYEVVDETN